ncbi:hypothetical protein CONPUDRAFT_81418 [Coniophora puteana RWD-64-598 SS2]|uniref:Uncharacterized protein n=1 Tax=Coniophora puteana (strain RWD-64-598) TaxID=741705 RepID=A0A5M3MXQ9_CONPW|nr:uncharacterized protein CONPUDRAFT_81418 [Coniophora puteana RWD-64-598 SS2]EIW83515.1 hypothetical protein CONPUDRAFT_81418 [Coniophora puteana RWD-64-598 SS2]
MEDEGQLPSTAAAARQRFASTRSATGSFFLHTPSRDASAAASIIDDHLVSSPTRDLRSSAFSSRVPSPDPDSPFASPRLDAVSSSQTVAGTESPDRKTSTKSWMPQWAKIPTIPVVWRNVLKCIVAYYLASLFTFAPPLSALLSDITTLGKDQGLPSPSGHMVATIVVYYNPAKTLGGMVESDTFCLITLVYSSIVCLCSVSMYWWFEVRAGWEWLADVLVILWIGVSWSGLSYMKVWMSKPTFNTAVNMGTIIMSIVIVKAGGPATLLRVCLIVVIGVCITNLVSVILWPQSATRNLQSTMTKTLDSFSTLLEMLTSTFLLEEPAAGTSHQPLQAHEKLQKAVEAHQASFTSLKRILGEAESEWLGGLSGTHRARTRRAYEDAVASLTRLAQHLNGLRSGTRLQFELAKGERDGRIMLRRGANASMTASVASSVVGHGGGDRGHDGRSGPERVSMMGTEDGEEALLQASADMFGDLVDDLGPPMKALTLTCTNSIDRLRDAFASSHTTNPNQAQQAQLMQAQDFQQTIEHIERALFTFESTSNHAVMRIYRRSDLPQVGDSDREGEGVNPFMAGSADNESIFLVYFFIFTLQEFAGELVSLVDAMRRLYACEQSRAARGGFWKRLMPTRLLKRLSKARKIPRPGDERTRRDAFQHRLSTFFKAPETHHRKVSFPQFKPHAPNTILTPNRANLPFLGRLKRRLWETREKLKGRNIKFAIKNGISLAILASPAFFDRTRPMFLEYRGEWALVSYMAVMSPTIGATNFASFHRFFGTFFAAGIAAGVYTLFAHNAIMLSLCGVVFSTPCFYFIVGKPAYATTGRMVLLTYNLTCLYTYNIRSRGDYTRSVLDIAYHRFVAVTLGLVWAAIVSRFWWPAEARRELSNALGEFCLNIGWLYTRLVAFNSGVSDITDLFDADSDTEDDDDAEEAHLLNASNLDHDHEAGMPDILPKAARVKLSNSIEDFMAMELHLQIKLLELQDLLAQTVHEPRLKGPFPVLMYRSILTSLQSTLDKLHSMRCVTTREEWFTSVRRDFILPVNKERHEMVGNIILYFSTLASAFRLKAPLPPYLPPAEQARQRLVEAIRQLDVVKNRDAKASRQLLFFAYALTMKGVTQELEFLGRTLQEAFGVIGQTSEEFGALFMA